MNNPSRSFDPLAATRGFLVAVALCVPVWVVIMVIVLYT